MVIPESGARFAIDATADGESGSHRIFSAQPAGNSSPGKVSLKLDGMAGRFAEIKLSAYGKGASWKDVGIVSRPTESPSKIACPGGECNIVIYTVDALRTDRLGCYGYRKPTSPNIDAFASRSVIFEKAYAPASWTRASIASLFTGVTPLVTGAAGRDDVLRNDIPTMAEYMRGASYHTAGFVSNGNIAPELGFARGFDMYLYVPEKPEDASVYPSSMELLDAALPNLDEIRQPFFAYIHTLDPHAPYTPSTENARRFIPQGAVETPADMETFKKFIWRNPSITDAQAAYLSGLYDGEVADADLGFARLIDWLEKRGIADRTIVIFTSDHGEEFLDHGGLGHGGTLYDELVHVPLIVHYPGGEKAAVGEPVSLLDILPTLAAVAGAKKPDNAMGYDLSATAVRPIYSYERLDKVEKESIIIWPFKLIHNINRTNQWGEPVLEYEFYNLASDPREQNGILREHRIARMVLMQALKEINDAQKSMAPPATGPSDISPDLKKRLEALGY